MEIKTVSNTPSHSFVAGDSVKIDMGYKLTIWNKITRLWFGLTPFIILPILVISFFTYNFWAITVMLIAYLGNVILAQKYWQTEKYQIQGSYTITSESELISGRLYLKKI